jgi:hypothetical protein
MLIGDFGVFRFLWPTWTDAFIMMRGYGRQKGGKTVSGYRIRGKGDAELYYEEGMNSLLDENEILCM